MKHLVASVVVLVAVASLTGCSTTPRTRTSADVFGAMKTELAHSLVNADAFDAMDDELAHAVGTTTVTSDLVLGPLLLPESRLSIASELRAQQTWGFSDDGAPAAERVSELELDGVPSSRE
jgi:hypothetical protein